MTEVGFAIIKGHGVDQEVISALRSGAMEFFAESGPVKQAYNYGPYGNPLGGYTGMGTEAVTRTRDEHGSDGGAANQSEMSVALPDLVESFIFKPDSPKPRPVSLEQAGHIYHKELLRVLGCLHHLTAAALGLPQDFFDRFYTPHAEVSLRLAHYPPLSDTAQASSAVRCVHGLWHAKFEYSSGSDGFLATLPSRLPTLLAPACARLLPTDGEHTDYTGFTILHQDESDVGDADAGGLQVRLRSGEWHAVRPQPGAFVVNIGDLYEVWTNGRWRSTVHRVMKPPAHSAAARAPRLSIPFFTGPHNDAIIEAMPTCVDAEHPPKYEPVRALDHLLRKLSASNV